MNRSETLSSINSQVELSNFLKGENREEIILEIFTGLSAGQKYISSRFFYDKAGSALFEEITKLSEYYPTRTEKTILRQAASEIIPAERNPIIVELGSGDCSKISILLDALAERDFDSIHYFPVDISEAAILESAECLTQRYPEINIHGLLADFMKHLDVLPGEGKRMICFFGSTLGNFTLKQAIWYIKKIRELMHPGDSLILGLDMVKDVEIIESAYNDKKGVTAAFNKNILNVINRIAKTNFTPEYFDHQAFYNPEKDRIEMHLVARRQMEVSSLYRRENFILDKGETIHTENSHKFSHDYILQLAATSGLSIKNIHTDQNNWFSVVHFKLYE
jgi:L-histidine N-alpha-methyltransferase